MISESSRCFPSPLPIRSPSPDTKNSNKLAKTISPALELRRQAQTSPHRQSAEYESLRRENEELREQLGLLGGTFPSEDVSRLKHRILEQDRLIAAYRRDADRASEPSQSLMEDSRRHDGRVEELKQRILEKDRIIAELKKILAHASETSQSAVHPPALASEELREKLRVLEIENDRLATLVKKLNKRDGADKFATENKALAAKVEELLMENNELEQKI
jgi:hypothetical protein